MEAFLARSISALAKIEWLDIIRTLSTAFTAFIAYNALKNWRKQDRAKREAEFLDELIEATHTYVAELRRPIELLRLAKIGMASHITSWEEGDSEEKVIKGAIAYINKRGEKDAKRLYNNLDECQKSLIRLESLSTKVQVFKFSNYNNCFNAITYLTWHFGRITAFSNILSPSWYWENPEVTSLLKKVMAIEPDEMLTSLGENHVKIIEFAQQTYQRIYG